ALIGIWQTRLLQFANPVAIPRTNAELSLRVAATNLVKLAPGLAEARIASSWLHCMDENWSAALADAREAERMPMGSQGGSGLVHALYGWYLMNVFDPQGGLQELLLAADANPSDPLNEGQLGNAYAQLHDFRSAHEHYKIALDLQPAQELVYEVRAHVYAEEGKILESIQDAETLQRMAGGNETNGASAVFTELRDAFLHGGVEAYWRKKLENELRVTPPDDPHEVAVCLKHLGQLQEAYDFLNRIEDPAKLRERLWWDIS